MDVNRMVPAVLVVLALSLSTGEGYINPQEAFFNSYGKA